MRLSNYGIYFLLLSVTPLLCGCPKLDMGAISSVDEWINECSSSGYNEYCQAIKQVTKNADRPLVIIKPNTDGKLLSETLRKLNQEQLLAIARANVFQGHEFSTGKMKSLDGQTREFKCDEINDLCRVEYLSGRKNYRGKDIKKFDTKKFRSSIYRMSSINKQSPIFLEPNKNNH